MSVLFENESGWLLDQQSFLSLQNVHVDKKTEDFSIRQELFDITNPFMMDSQFEKQAQQRADNSKKQEDHSMGDNPTKQDEHSKGDNPTKQDEHSRGDNSTENHIKRNKIKLKRKLSSNLDNEFDKFHAAVSEIVSRALKSVLCASKDRNILAVKSKGDNLDNNASARLSAIILGPGDRLREHCETETCKCEPLAVKLESTSSYNNPYHKLIKNENDFSIMISISADSYLIPARSTFVIGNIENLKLFVDHFGRGSFDFILLDPPWENKSVKRNKSYWTMKNEQLFRIPIPELLVNGGLVAVWVTNRIKHINFIKDELFPFWHVTYLTTWYWLKMTKNGEPVCDIKSNHKKPYELLLIGRFNKKQEVENDTNNGYLNSDKSTNHMDNFPLNKTIISVPSSLHSSKVSLHDILKPILPNGAKCLELFARNLTPGWVSYGNETIKHQHLDYFTKL